MESPECSGATTDAKDRVKFLSRGKGIAFFSVSVGEAGVRHGLRVPRLADTVDEFQLDCKSKQTSRGFLSCGFEAK
jgi:hypothetical protein